MSDDANHEHIQNHDDEQDPLEWIYENHEQVEALADRDLRTADTAHAIFEYRDTYRQ